MNTSPIPLKYKMTSGGSFPLTYKYLWSAYESFHSIFRRLSYAYGYGGNAEARAAWFDYLKMYNMGEEL